VSIQGSRPISLHLTALGMETSCLYAGLVLMKERLGWGLFPFLLILLSYPSFSLATRMLMGGARHAWGRRAIIIFGLAFILAPAAFYLVNMYGTADFRFKQVDILAVLYQIGLCALLWWLGTVFMPHKSGYRHVHVRFQVATLLMLAFVLLGADRAVPVILFFLFAFTALALARFDSSASLSMGTLKPMKTQTLTPGILLILVPVSIFLFVLSPDLARSLLRILGSLAGGFIGWLDRVAVPPPAAGKQIQISLFSGCRVKAPREASPITGMQSTPDVADGNDQVVLWFAVARAIRAGALLWYQVKVLNQRKYATLKWLECIESEKYHPIPYIEIAKHFEHRKNNS